MRSLELPAAWRTQSPLILVAGVGRTGWAFTHRLAAMLADRCEGLQCRPTLRLFDGDVVEAGELARWGLPGEMLGENKARLCAARVTERFGLPCEAVAQPASPLNLSGEGAGLLVTCIDRIDVRVEIAKTRRRIAPFWMDVGCEGARAQVVLGHLRREDKWIPNVFDLYPEMVEIPEDGEKLSHLVAEHAATAAASLLEAWFSDGRLDYHGVMIETQPPRWVSLGLDPTTWLAFGWRAR